MPFSSSNAPYPANEPLPSGNAFSVLVVEDQAALRVLVCEMLAQRGWETAAAADAADRGWARIEAAIDRFGGEIHPESKKAKDCGSAAQLITLVWLVGLWAAALLGRI